MRLALFLGACLAALGVGSIAVGCTERNAVPDAGGGVMDAGRDAGRDAGPATCSSDLECDDGFPCTSERCGAGGVCSYTPIDERCAMGERCIVGVGCRMGMAGACTNAAECDDGNYCNGVEDCIGPAGNRVCVIGTDVDCDDGNSCSIDMCDETTDGCRYELAPGCDAGMPSGDGGAPCPDFDPTMHYPGTFTFRPSALSACMASATYNVNEIAISRSAGSLSIRADRFTLSQAPAPADGSFDVSFTDSCASFRLVGAFTCANQWSGMWTATFSGACATCPGQSLAVRGSRR